MGWAAWLCVASLLALHCALPWPIRLSVALLLPGAAAATLWRCILLKGARAVRLVEWAGAADDCHVCVGPERQRLRAKPQGCWRHGALWLLRFQSPEGRFQVLVDARYQNARAMRRLARHLLSVPGCAPGGPPDAWRRQADTMPPKV